VTPGDFGDLDDSGAFGQTLTILVVEDDPALGELLRALLNRVPGWGATVVHDAAAARLLCQHVQVEVLVVDVNLPGISGLELLAMLRADPDWRDPPAILMSARPDQPGIEAALEEGTAWRFIAKPFDVDELIAAVREAVGDRGGDGGEGEGHGEGERDGGGRGDAAGGEGVGEGVAPTRRHYPAA
jgi:DNA-binding response OmpR family regulator